jgi:hypothetical protein
VDAAAVSALRAACSIDAVAPVRCPAALLLEVAGEAMLLQAALLCSDHVPTLSRHVQMLLVTDFGGGR